MKFRRNVRMYRGALDAAPVAAVFFLLVMFLALGSRIYTPGVQIELPAGTDVSGTDKPTFTVALDSAGRFYYQNQIIDREALKTRMVAAAKATPDLVLVVLPDKAATIEQWDVLRSLANAAGIREARDARLPRPPPPAASLKPATP